MIHRIARAFTVAAPCAFYFSLAAQHGAMIPTKIRSDTMTDIKKDHSVGEGTGAVTGAVTGAAVGSAGGPVGTVVGALAGGVLGAKAGGKIAEAVNPTAYNDHWKKT